MGTTNNYNWPTPVATDLVKDGWEAIKDLGDAADTTVKAVSDATGLVHISTTSFTTSSAESFNNVFTSTYDNYRLIIDFVGSTSSVANLRLRLSGTDDSNALYQRQYLTTSAASSTSARQGNQSLWAIQTTSTSRQNYVIEIANPNLATSTSLQAIVNGNYNSSTTVNILFNMGGHNSLTQFDGFTFYPDAGTLTGIISIYGYRKS